MSSKWWKLGRAQPTHVIMNSWIHYWHTPTHLQSGTGLCVYMCMCVRACVCVCSFIIMWVGRALPNSCHFDDIIFNLRWHSQILDTVLLNSLSIFFFNSFFSYYFLSLFLHQMKTVESACVLIVPCVSLYRWVHFSRAVLVKPVFQLYCT